MGKVIHYDEVAKKWLKEEEQQIKNDYLSDKLFKNICKIFEWDIFLNKIC